MSDITSANAVFIITVPDLAIVHQVQGFAADNAFDVDAVQIAINIMGVDGKKSSAYIPVLWAQNVHLQADSDSKLIFDLIAQMSISNMRTYQITGTINLPSVGASFALSNGTVTDYKPLPDAKQYLQPMDFSIVWEAIRPTITP